MKYINRRLVENINSALKSFQVIVVSGARQVGKSTMLKTEFSDFKYLSLDDYNILEQARISPGSLWKGYNKIIIDEVQKAPEILSMIKLLIDNSDKKIRFILSGSSNLLLQKNVSESLAGRAIYFSLLPFSISEINNTQSIIPMVMKNPETIKCGKYDNYKFYSYLWKGFMPPLLYLKNENDVMLWWDGYIKTYLERDLRDFSRIDSLIDFRRLLTLVAIRSGNILNQSEISRDAGMKQPTAHRYMKLMEVSNIVSKVYPFFSNKIKRVVKSPKIYMVDPGLAVYLSGNNSVDALKKSREVGSFFETMIYLQLRVITEVMGPGKNIYYFRDISGLEVDFIIEDGKKLFPVEVKSSSNVSARDCANMLKFMKYHENAKYGALIYAGSEIKWLHDKIICIPWYMV